MKALWRRKLGWLLILLVSGCIDPYSPPEITAPNSYLVVDGFLDSSPGAVTTIRLSRTQNITDNKPPTAEARATVSIESEGNESYRLPETSSGVYSLSGVSPQTGQQYRLRIRTAQGIEYLSDMVPVKPTPKIDNVSWRVENNGVQIYVNTSDPQNDTRYYRWEFDETWKFTAGFRSGYVIRNDEVVFREEDIYRCWGNSRSTGIFLGSSAKLSRDVISNYPLMFVPGSSFKFTTRYSILVKQYALTQDAYEYWDLLAKTTQNLGSLFDPQPSQVTGNLRCVSNPTEPVLGYFSVGSVETRRIYINRTELPFRGVVTGYEGCMLDTLPLREVISQGKEIVSPYEGGRYLATDLSCVDCRLRGTTVQPSFWED